MKDLRRVFVVGVFVFISFATHDQSTQAGFITIAWSGFAEGKGANEFGFAGDGDPSTPTDGTPFSLSFLVDDDAIDSDAANDQASFPISSVSLIIGTEEVGPTATRFGVNLIDNRNRGESDYIRFVADITFNRHEGQFESEALLPISTFSLDASDDETFPTFSALTIQNFTSELSNAFIHVNNMTVVSASSPSVGPAAVPEPSSLMMFGVAIIAFASVSRRKRKNVRGCTD